MYNVRFASEPFAQLRQRSVSRFVYVYHKQLTVGHFSFCAQAADEKPNVLYVDALGFTHFGVLFHRLVGSSYVS
jgi:hypothetical protein